MAGTFATIKPTPAEILAALITVDGAGSGLDADLLDAQSSAAFETAGATATHAALTAAHGATGAVVGTTNTQILSGKTLTTPTISDFTNAAHTHQDAAGGGQLATAALANDAVTDAKLRNSGALSVIGRSVNSGGDPADISASAAGAGVLRESGSTIGFGTVATAGIANDAITFAKMQNVATDRLIGRDTAASGDLEEISLGASLEWSGSASIQRAALTGDVTATANSNATAIANDAVTNAKLANMAEVTVKGRAVGAGTGDPVDLSVTELNAIVGSANIANPNLSTLGHVRTRTDTINDDSVVSFTPNQTSGLLLISSTADAALGGVITWRAAASPFCAIVVVGAQIEVSTAALVGTTGTDGKFTVSAAADGKIYLENRRAAVRTVRITLVC